MKFQYAWFCLLALLMRKGPNWLRHWRLLCISLKRARRFGSTASERTLLTRPGFRITVRMDDWLGQHVYATGDYEPPTTALVQAVAGPGDVLVDIGGNIGYFTLLFAKQACANGRVYSFEPIPELRARLEENVRLNRFENVAVSSFAASDRRGECSFFVGPQSHMGVSSLRRIAASSQTINVETRPLDDFDFGGKSINLAKIDVEGAECAVLRGMRGILNNDHPDLIIEVTDRALNEMGDSATELFGLLRELGYRAYWIDFEGLRALSGWSDHLPPQFNAYFTCRVHLPESLKVISEDLK